MTLSHPDHFLVERPRGLTPAVAAMARVRELVCGAGRNLLSMAATLPDAKFTGVDLSERQIEMARSAAQADRLANVKFLTGDALAGWQIQHVTAAIDLQH